MKTSRFVLALASYCIAIASPASGALMSVTSSADSFVSSNTGQNAANSATISNSNYGAAGALGVAASGLAKGEFDSFIKFNLASVKSGFDALYGAGSWTVNGITLKLTSTAPNNNIFNGFGTGPGGTNVNTAGSFAVSWIQNDSWIEGTGVPNSGGTDINSTHVNFTNHLNYITPGTDEALGTFSFTGGTTGSNTYSLGLTSSLLSEVLSGSAASLYLTPSDPNIAYLFNSRTSPGNEPTLSVSAVPEPSGFVIGIAAMACDAMRRRRNPAE